MKGFNMTYLLIALVLEIVLLVAFLNLPEKYWQMIWESGII